MHEYFARKKPSIAREVANLLAARSEEFSHVNGWGGDLARRLADFASRGKMVRGGLLLLGREMLAPIGKREPRAAIQAAAALEILHSSLLIHDDIMDDDRIRRGALTVFAQYEQAAERAGAANPERIGRSMGICAGDVGFFIAWGILSRLRVNPMLRASLLSLVARELAYVGLAQMRDVSVGSLGKPPTPNDIMRLYLYKTARYSFSLPLMSGAMLAGAGARTIERLGALGERIGIVFQMRDDDLGLFSAERRTGKPIGSDIREGRMTLLYLELLRSAEGAERLEFEALLGSRSVSASSLRRVRQAMDRLGVRQRVAARMADDLREADLIISRLPIGEAHRRILREICEESSRRRR